MLYSLSAGILINETSAENTKNSYKSFIFLPCLSPYLSVTVKNLSEKMQRKSKQLLFHL